MLLLLSGFLREFTMININTVLKSITTYGPDYSVDLFNFLESWSVNDIIKLKWGLTVVFMIHFWAITWLLLRTYFNTNNKAAGKSVTYVYTGIFLLSGVLYIAGMVFGTQKEIYPVVRTLTGISHSFIPAILIFLYLKYLPKQVV